VVALVDMQIICAIFQGEVITAGDGKIYRFGYAKIETDPTRRPRRANMIRIAKISRKSGNYQRAC